MKNFATGTVNRRRQSELGADVVFSTRDIGSFAAENGLSFGSYLGGEFWEVRKAGARVGTVWIDYQLPIASGGGISVQQNYECYLAEDTGEWLSKYVDSYAVEYLVVDPA